MKKRGIKIKSRLLLLAVLFVALAYLHQASAITGVKICSIDYACSNRDVSDGICPEDFKSPREECVPRDTDCSLCRPLSASSCGYRSGCENCNSKDGWYCGVSNPSAREYRDYDSCRNFECAFSPSSSEDCSAKASTDSDSSASDLYRVAGTVTDYAGCSSGTCTINPYADTCASTFLLTEYSASGTSFTSTTKNCNDYDTGSCGCTVSADTLSRACDDWNCANGQCQDSGSDLTTNTWSCGLSTQCQQQKCAGLIGSTYTCYRKNEGSWAWSNLIGLTETNCNDGYDNDCDGYTDGEDNNCPLTLTLNPALANPSQLVRASLSQSYSIGTVIIADYLGCDSQGRPIGAEICRFSPPTSSCTFNAPKNCLFTYGYFACLGSNSDQETLSVKCPLNHCSSSSSHSSSDEANPSTYRHYLTSGATWNSENCNGLDTYNCANECNTATGDIDNRCDDYHCNNVACVYSGNRYTLIPRVQDCSDTCTGEASASFQAPDADVVDNELCSAGQLTCPSASIHDSCSGSTLSEYYCSGADRTVSAKNCNDFDGNYCNGNNLEVRDYSCYDPVSNGAYCSFSAISSENCALKSSVDSDSGSPDSFKQAGTVTDYTSCSVGGCTSTVYQDSCSGTTVTEYSASGSNRELATSTAKNCELYEITSCNADNKYYRQDWGCSGTPGFCNDAAVADTRIGSDADSDGVDKECGDATCDLTAGVCDTAVAGKCSGKTQTETSCSDNLDNDCDGKTDGSKGANSDTDCCVYSQASETICDSIDNDCDGTIDEGCDDDNDNYCDSGMTVSGTPLTCTSGGGDCNDNDANVNPGKAELCSNSLDDNCNLQADCIDLACAGQSGPGGATCCQTAATCAQDDCRIEACTNNFCAYTNRPSGAVDECGTCQACNAAGGDCAGLTANDGKSCADDCSYCNAGICAVRPSGAVDECGTCQACNAAGGDCLGINAETGKGCSSDCYDCVSGICAARTENNDGNCNAVCNSCINGACLNRNSCDQSECPQGAYCDDSGACKTPDESGSVCLNCAPDQTVGYAWTWSPSRHEDAGKGYSTNSDVYTSLFNSNSGACKIGRASCRERV